jgi:hypothetical protein
MASTSKSPFLPVADSPTEPNTTTINTQSFQLSPGDLVKKLQPWNTFFAGDHFSRPASLDDLLKRLRANPRHFLVNYLCAALLLLVYCAYSLPYGNTHCVG